MCVSDQSVDGPVTTLSRGAVTVSCDLSGSTGEQQEVWLLRRRRAMGRGTGCVMGPEVSLF